MSVLNQIPWRPQAQSIVRSSLLGTVPEKCLLLLATTCKDPLYFIDRIILHLLVKQGDTQVRGT